MRAAVRVDGDMVAAKDILAADGGALCHQCVRDHDGVVRALAHKVVVQGSRGGVAAVADDLTVHGADAVGCAHQTVCTVGKGGHAVVDVGHGAGTVGPCHHSLLVGGGAVADADHHAVLGQVMGQGKAFVVLRCKGHITDVATGGLLIVLELLHAGLCNVLRRLCALVLHVEVGALKVDAKDLGTLIAALHHVGHIGHGIGQHLHALGDGSGQKAGHALGDDMLGPVAQALRLCVVGVELIGTMAVDVHKAGNDALGAVVHIGLLFPIGENAGDPALLQLQCSRHKLVGKPYLLALDDHTLNPPYYSS